MTEKQVLAITGKYLRLCCRSIKAWYPLSFKDEKTGVEGFGLQDEAFPNVFIVGFLASNERKDWFTNFDHIKISSLIKLILRTKTYALPKSISKVKIHKGFSSGYIAVRDRLIEGFVKSRCPEICFIGYSMGGGLAPIAAFDFWYNFPLIKVACCFDGPKVFNKIGQTLYDEKVPTTIRFQYGNDIVSKLPPFDYYHVGKYIHIGPKENFSLSFKDHAEYRQVADEALRLGNG